MGLFVNFGAQQAQAQALFNPQVRPEQIGVTRASFEAGGGVAAGNPGGRPVTEAANEAGISTQAGGEEGGGANGNPDRPVVSTQAGGEEGGTAPGNPGRPNPGTTEAVGEEGGGVGSTRALGEEGGGPIATTLAVGEEGGGVGSTRALGEEGGGNPSSFSVQEIQRLIRLADQGSRLDGGPVNEIGWDGMYNGQVSRQELQRFIELNRTTKGSPDQQRMVQAAQFLLRNFGDLAAVDGRGTEISNTDVARTAPNDGNRSNLTQRDVNLIGGVDTTLALGEEGGVSTMAGGEEGGGTTFALGEEGGGGVTPPPYNVSDVENAFRSADGEEVYFPGGGSTFLGDGLLTRQEIQSRLERLSATGSGGSPVERGILEFLNQNYDRLVSRDWYGRPAEGLDLASLQDAARNDGRPWDLSQRDADWNRQPPVFPRPTQPPYQLFQQMMNLIQQLLGQWRPWY